jgi:hypothetical protein
MSTILMKTGVNVGPSNIAGEPTPPPTKSHKEANHKAKASGVGAVSLMARWKRATRDDAYL